jgi:hypothetical protein
MPDMPLGEQLKTVILKVDVKKIPANVLPAEAVKKYAIDDMISLLVCPPEKEMKTISGRRIIGIVKDHEMGILKENVITNPEFRKFILKLAGEEINNVYLREIRSSELGATAIIDERTAGVRGDIGNEEIIGLFKKTPDGKIIFEGNPNFAIISRLGLCRLTAGIRNKLYSLPN